jgi:hypothetical protein
MTDRHSPSIAKGVAKFHLGEKPKAVRYWRSQSYPARLEALEEIRQDYHRWKKDAQPALHQIHRSFD